VTKTVRNRARYHLDSLGSATQTPRVWRETLGVFPKLLRRCCVFAFLALLLVSCLLPACGYVQVKVTASPVPPTPTGPVLLQTPARRATATAVPSTPLPTSTPTPTPTPIVHIVQQGDLLIHIASQYDVSVQAIIEVNAIANPHSLPVGQELTIPRSEEDLLALQPTATPTPMPLDVIHVGFHRTPVGSLWCMGEVKNERNEALDLVQVQVTLFNAGGEVLDRAASFAAADVVPGHGVAPFAILLPGAPAAGYAGYEIIVLSAEPITHWGRRHRELTVEDVSGEMKQGTLTVQGTIRNRGTTDAEQVRVTITAYGSEGTVVGIRQTELDALEAGAQEDLLLSLVPAATAVRVEAVAWGMKVPD
jgi:LysM repeat protein